MSDGLKVKLKIKAKGPEAKKILSSGLAGIRPSGISINPKPRLQ